MYLITGMHRSGTSLVARFFFEAGADLGDPATFYQPDRWNPDGYFEQTEIHAINMPLINGPWGKFAYFRLPSTSTMIKRAERFCDEISRASEKYQGRVVKENRFCLTLPAWRYHGTAFDQVLICLRHPAAVVRSIQRRNRIPLSIGYRLWRTHLERLLEHAQDLPVRFVLYENILDVRSVCGDLNPALASAGVECSGAQLQQLHSQLVRTRPTSSDEVPSQLPSQVAELWDDLLRRHASQE